MPISSDNTKLYIDRTDPSRPVGITLGEMMKCLGYYKRDKDGKRNLGMIIKYADINKWSKHKWVRSTSTSPLTEAERKAASGDEGTGYVYGVRVRYISTTSLANIHNWEFTYARPTGAPFLYRMTDGDGYDHKARADVFGEFVTPAYRDMDDNFRVLIDVDTTGSNTTGISVKELIKEELSMSGSTDAQAFGYVYPFLLVGDYMCAMKNTKTSAVTPICDNGTWYDDFYGSLGALNDIEQIPLGTSTPFSVALMRVMANDPIMQPFIDGEWHLIGGIDGSQVTSVYAYPMPNAVGAHLNVSDFGNYPPVLTLGLPTVAGSKGFSVGLAFDGSPRENVVMKLTARLQPDNLVAVKDYTYIVGGGAQIAPTWSWSNFGISGTPLNGTKYTLTVSAVYYYGSASLNTRTATATGELTVDTSTTGGLTPIDE